MTVIRLVLLATVLGASLAALAQQPAADYSIALQSGGTFYPEASIVVAMTARASYGMGEDQPFVAKLKVPPGLSVQGDCGSAISPENGSFDPVTRVFTWSSRFFDSAPAGTENCPLTMLVDRSTGPGTVMVFEATIETPFAEQNRSNNTASLLSVVLAATDIAASASADVQHIRLGGTFHITASVTNRGAVDAANVELTNTMSPLVTFVSFEQLTGPTASLDQAPQGRKIGARIPVLPPGATATFRVGMRASTTADLAHWVHVRSTTLDPLENNNASYTLVFAGPDADLGITSTLGPASAGALVPLTISVTNRGPDTVDGVQVRQELWDQGGQWDLAERVKYSSLTPSQGTCAAPEVETPFVCPPMSGKWTVNCSLGTLAPGARATIAVVVDRGDYRAPFDNIASVGPMQNDSNRANNQVSVDLSKPAKRARGVRQ